MIDILRTELLTDNSVHHGFTKRNGNLTTKLSPRTTGTIDQVAQNLEEIIVQENISKLAYLYLEGGSNCVEINSDLDGHTTLLDCDGAVTDKPLTLAITVADCFPVLLIDPVNQIIGISHAGWKGTSGNITSKVLRAMINLGAEKTNIIASIGPGICGKCFEVGDEVAKQFDDKFVDWKNFSKPHVDILAANIAELEEFGVQSIDIAETVCTLENQEEYYSARGSEKTGRFMAYITNNTASA